LKQKPAALLAYLQNAAVDVRTDLIARAQRDKEQAQRLHRAGSSPAGFCPHAAEAAKAAPLTDR
jgi:hypothetical protein